VKAKCNISLKSFLIEKEILNLFLNFVWLGGQLNGKQIRLGPKVPALPFEQAN